ncbi:MAG TPA: D-aminoacylase [Pirellulaceae bacterium]|jgi:N-acyl-D-amino-acid deacylase
MYDLLFTNGTVIDGTGAPRITADVAVTGDKIAAVGRLAGATARQTIDCKNRVVAPGFIDVHNHSDGWMLLHPHQTWKTQQGFTTEVLMADGISYAPVEDHNWRPWLHYLRSLNGLALSDYRGWRSLADYMALLDGHNVQNSATHVPYANVRTMACGFGRVAAPNDMQMREIKVRIRQGMEQGAVGLSTGLDYIDQCHASIEEIATACAAIQPYDGLYVTHIRYKIGLLPALREAVEIGRRAGVKVHISHLKGSTEQEVQQVLEFIDNEARKQVDFSFESYPYQRGSTMVNFLLPYEVWEDGPLGVINHLDRPDVRAHFREALAVFGTPLSQIHIAWTAAPRCEHLHGMPLDEFVRQTNKSAEEALIDLLIDSNLATLLVAGPPLDHLVEPLLKHDLAMLGSDGIYFANGHVHPRVYGSAGRWLGPLVRDRKVFSLEEAVHKLSGRSAARFGLPNRGIIREGAFADLVVFDPTTITDHATYEQPTKPCAGIDHVVINGQVIVTNGQPAKLPSEGALSGKYLRRGSHLQL